MQKTDRHVQHRNHASGKTKNASQSATLLTKKPVLLIKHANGTIRMRHAASTSASAQGFQRTNATTNTTASGSMTGVWPIVTTLTRQGAKQMNPANGTTRKTASSKTKIVCTLPKKSAAATMIVHG
jgi:hypothetical protein